MLRVIRNTTPSEIEGCSRDRYSLQVSSLQYLFQWHYDIA